MQNFHLKTQADLLSTLLVLSSIRLVKAGFVALLFGLLFFDSILAFLERAKLLIQLPRVETDPTKTKTFRLEKR